MTSPLNHVWGVSPAQDRVWAQVSGLAPNKAGARLFLVLQAYIDDSYNQDGVFVLGGHIASAEAWARFSGEWEKMRPFGTLDKNNEYHFKMSEMAQNDERMARVQGFFRIIENHVLASISCKIDISELRRAKGRIWVPNLEIDWGYIDNPYMVAMRCLLDIFHGHRQEMAKFIPLDEKVDFYFDDQSEKGAILSAWDDYIRERSDEVRQYYGATPRFENDKEFLPLQAADLWAWWVRKWYKEGTPEKIENCDFGAFRGRRHDHLKIAMSFDEEDIVSSIKSFIRDQIGPDRVICDAKFS